VKVPERATGRTMEQYDHVIAQCRDLFTRKTTDYGTAWRVLRPISIVDQIFIKAQRIRTIQEKRAQKIGDDIRSEFVGIVNYAIIGLIQLRLPEDAAEDIPVDRTLGFYDKEAAAAQQLMQDKNHDYGEAWRSMSQESFTDLVLMKLARIRQILANKGKTIASEGIDANYYDILNYAVFALILMDEDAHQTT
jgi:hypothetical protein